MSPERLKTILLNTPYNQGTTDFYALYAYDDPPYVSAPCISGWRQGWRDSFCDIVLGRRPTCG